MDSARARAGYADARFVRSRVERLSTRNGRLDQLDSRECEGIGVRVRVGGAWGFAAVRGTDRADAEAALTRALAIAAAQPAVPDAAPLAPEPPARGSWTSPARARPVRGAARGEARACCWPPTPACATEPGVTATRRALRRPCATRQAVRLHRGRALRAAADRVRRRHRRPWRSTATRARCAPSRRRTAATWRRPATSTSSALDLPGQAPRVAEEAVALLQRARRARAAGPR